MGIWSIPLYQAIWHVGGWFVLVFLAVLGARLVVSGRRWLTQLAIATASAMAIFVCFMFTTEYYYDYVNPKPEFMAQCQLASSESACLASFQQIYQPERVTTR